MVFCTLAMLSSHDLHLVPTRVIRLGRKLHVPYHVIPTVPTKHQSAFCP